MEKVQDQIHGVGWSMYLLLPHTEAKHDGGLLRYYWDEWGAVHYRQPYHEV